MNTETYQKLNWSHIIRNHISRGSHKEALGFYTQIRRSGGYAIGIVPLLLKACASISLLRHGKTLHSESIKSGADTDLMVGTSFVDMYAKCGDTVDSRRAFDGMLLRNVVTWNAMVGGYTRNRDLKSASQLFEKMSIRTDVTWIEMIQGYARIGDLTTARKLFDDVPPELRNVVTWTVMVDGYASHGEMKSAEQLYDEMPQRNCVVWSSMISGYFKKGNVKEAIAIFDRIPARNLVNWNSLISGFAQNGLCKEALNSFTKMQSEGFDPDEITFTSILSVCSQLGLLDLGKEIHQTIIQRKIKLNLFVLNGLIDMYAKCGDLDNARSIFETISHKNNACWNSIISCLAIHGQCKEAIEFFSKMENSNEKPNEISFLSVLSACAHGGFVNEGLEVFSKMEKYGLEANIKHYGCLIDLLGRAGRLEEAYDMIKRMPVKANETVLGALLGACRVHMDMNMADRLLEEVKTPDLSYVVLSNIYAASERWEKTENIRVLMSNKGFKKTPGCSSVLL